MPRLTDTQLIILSAASQRDDRGVELPANLKGEAARKVVDKLICAGLLEEVRASGSLPVWRRDDDSGPMALRITKTGLEAIDVEDEATAALKETRAHPAPFHHERRIPVRRGRSRHEVKQVYIRFCFSDTATADAFRNRFGGECLTHAPGNPKLRTPATSSDAPAVKREAEEDSTKRDGDNGWQQPDHDLRP